MTEIHFIHVDLDCFYRDQSRCVPSQWETLLHCNDISHWLGTHLDWSLFYAVCMAFTHWDMSVLKNKPKILHISSAWCGKMIYELNELIPARPETDLRYWDPWICLSVKLINYDRDLHYTWASGLFCMINSSLPNAVYMHQWTGSAMVQVIQACSTPSRHLNQCWLIVNCTL